MKTKIQPKKIIHHSRSGKKKKKFLGEARAGTLYLIVILGLVALAASSAAGGIVPTIKQLAVPPAPKSLYSCCDSGDGKDCHPILEKQITYKGQVYALLKSNIVQAESMHVVPSNEFTPDGQRIFINTSESTAKYTIPGCEHGKDLIGIQDPSNPMRMCFGVPDDELIYVCRDTAERCNNTIDNNRTPFDVYFRIADGDVPTEITSYCPKPNEGFERSSQEVVSIPTPGGRSNLQLEWFQVRQKQKLSTWLGAWCKPAINLYPTTKTNVTVEVHPKGDFTYTEPSYPDEGWKATAYPDGRIVYGKIAYPYLYWEAEIQDNLIPEQKKGYVVEYSNLADLFETILPKLGLNKREQQQFSEYWLKVLPKSNYYLVGVVPQTVIDDLAPLKISPTPDSLLRVTLTFKALDHKIEIAAPALTGFDRHGFTVTEWGGFFKTDKNHKGFSCLM
jgi:hypothetical protein